MQGGTRSPHKIVVVAETEGPKANPRYPLDIAFNAHLFKTENLNRIPFTSPTGSRGEFIPLALTDTHPMKIFSWSAVDDLGLSVLKKALFYATLFVTCVLSVSLIWLGEKYEFSPIGLVVVVAISGGFVAFFAVPSAIERMKQDKSMFLREAIVHTFYAYLMLGSFIPIVGPLIANVFGSDKTADPSSQTKNKIRRDS